MRYGQIPGLDKPVSRLVQGTVTIEAATPENFRLLDAAFAAGINAFDTAHVYGVGKVERAFGQWLERSGLRGEVVILGKGAHHNGDRKRVTPFDITADLHDSLARLQTDYIDLYVLHRDDPEVPVDEIVDVLNQHQDAGLIRAFGGSNWSYERIETANQYAAQNDLTPFALSSPNFSLAEQIKPPWEGCVSISGPQGTAARAYYREQQTPLFTWSSLAGGFFSGRFRRDNLDSFTDYFGKLCVDCYATPANFERLDRAERLAEQRGLSLPQLALAYVLNVDLNIHALVGSSTPAEVRANVEALDLELSPEELRWLEHGT